MTDKKRMREEPGAPTPTKAPTTPATPTPATPTPGTPSAVGEPGGAGGEPDRPKKTKMADWLKLFRKLKGDFQSGQSQYKMIQRLVGNDEAWEFAESDKVQNRIKSYYAR
eukprot:8927240-Pyramimonas_sp.AAC.1